MTAGTECASEDDTVQQAAAEMTQRSGAVQPSCGVDKRLKAMLTDRDIDGHDLVGMIAQPMWPTAARRRSCA